MKPGVTTRDIASKWPSAKEAWGYEEEDQAAANNWGHGLGLAQYDPPVISRIWSLDHPVEILEGMTFALETQHGKMFDSRRASRRDDLRHRIRLRVGLDVQEPRDHRDRLIFDLDDDRCLDPGRAGAKAAWLARGRRAGLPVLPGVVAAAEESTTLLLAGAAALRHRGSGGARLVVGQAELPASLREEIRQETADLAAPLVVRSSSLLEGSGEWSGAFTSYLDVDHEELPKAVTGCWASAFTVSTLERFAAAGIEPASSPMAVLIQPALQPDFGGTARIDGDEVSVIGVSGSPAPLVQGWEPGAHGKVTPTGVVLGGEAIALMGEEVVSAVATTIRHARETTGANACEWATVGGEVFLLQLMRTAEIEMGEAPVIPALVGEKPMQIARMVRRNPGPLGEALILPWAVADPGASLVAEPPADNIDALEALRSAGEHAAVMTAEAWGLPKAAARARAQDTLREFRGSQPGPALARLEGLHPIDSERSRYVRGLVARVRLALVAAGHVGDSHAAWYVEPGRAAELLQDGTCWCQPAPGGFRSVGTFRCRCDHVERSPLPRYIGRTGYRRRPYVLHHRPGFHVVVSSPRRGRCGSPPSKPCPASLGLGGGGYHRR